MRGRQQLAKPLNAAQQRFCQEYLKDLNGTRAYQAVYPKAKAGAARTNAARLLAKARVAAYLGELATSQKARLELEADTILRELMRLALVDPAEAFDDAGNLRPLREMPLDLRRAIAGIDVVSVQVTGDEQRTTTTAVRKVRFWDKVKALETLGRHLALWTDKVQHQLPPGGGVLMIPTPVTAAQWSDVATQQQATLAKVKTA